MKSRRLPDTDPSEQLDVSVMVCCHNCMESALDVRIDWLQNGVYERLADKWAGNYDRFDALHAAVSAAVGRKVAKRSEEHTSELQSHSCTLYAVSCLKKNNLYL